jgi:hypothetical protein
MKRPEKFSDYPANAVDENDYVEIAFQFIRRITPNLDLNTARKVAKHVAYDAFLPKYSFAEDDDIDSIGNWPWPEIESLARQYPKHFPLVDHGYWNEIKEINIEWLMEGANISLHDWLTYQSIDKLRTWQRRNNLRPARTKAALAEQLADINDVLMIAEWHAHREEKLQEIKKIEFLKVNPPVEQYIKRLIKLTWRHLDFYHTATNSIFGPDVQEARALESARSFAKEEIQDAYAKNTDEFEKEMARAFDQLLGKRWRHRLAAKIYFSQIINRQRNIASSTIDQRTQFHLQNPLIYYSCSLTITDQCGICSEQKRDRKIKFIDQKDLPPFHPACLCKKIVWEKQYGRTEARGKHFEEAYKRIMKPKIQGIGVKIPTLREIIELTEASLRDMSLLERIWLRIKHM